MKKNFLLTTFLVFLSLGFYQVQAQDFDDFGGEGIDFTTTLSEVKEIMILEDETASRARSFKKIDKGLRGFLETEFITKYKDIKLEAESLAATFKAHQSSFPPADVIKVKKAYTKIADKFNLQLMDIKADFMDRKTLKSIRKRPDWYSNSLELKLRNLKDEYSHDFERVVAEVTGDEVHAAGPLFAILGLVKLTGELANYIARSSFNARQVKEEHLNQFLIEPYSFKSWEEIEVIEGDIYNKNSGEEDMEDYDNSEDEEDMDPFGEGKSKKKKKKKKN